jgi:hypothetical protein
MKKISLFVLIIFTVIFQSCKKDETTSKSSSNNQTNANTALEGSWLLQNISGGSRITFAGSVFTIVSGTVTIQGTFTYVNTVMTCSVTSRSGANSGALTPDNFTGNATLSSNGNIVTFTNFSGNWTAVFSTWYGKI